MTTSGKIQKRTGAWLVRHALEQLPVSYTFGIPGVHNTEIYDELNKSELITPVLVTHECGAAFMADALSRTTDKIGVLVIVPAAGATHAMSGIGEACLDGIPLLIISGGTRRDIDKKYQVHQFNQHAVLQGITKATFLIKEHDAIVSTIFQAYKIAVTGEPGPVFVEIPADIQLFKGPVEGLPTINMRKVFSRPPVKDEEIEKAAELLSKSQYPCIFAGWGAREGAEHLIELAELLEAPVSTTLQGLSVFPAKHPLHTGMGFGPSSVPAAENAFRNCDCLLAVGTRFGEIPTGSFGVIVPDNLIHIDINPEVFHANYPARLTIEADAPEALKGLLAVLKTKSISSLHKQKETRKQISSDKKRYYEEWENHQSKRVNPYLFFKELRNKLDDDAITVVDDGNHTFLFEELFPVYHSKHCISPTDFNAMGYCVPGAIGAQLGNPEKQVVGIVGDGAFIMTCMEIITASTHNLGIIYFVFHDGELSQIAQGQEIPYNRKTCTILGNIKLEGVATATGAGFVSIDNNDSIGKGITDAIEISKGKQPVIVDVAIDYSKRTRFTQGVVKTVLKRFPLGDKFRFIGRALVRKISG